MYCIDHDLVLDIGVAILGAEAPVVRKSLHEGQLPMVVAHLLVTDKTVKEEAAVLTELGQQYCCLRAVRLWS